jgi:hypothetical protein
MHPDRELSRLAAHKKALRRRISLNRTRCAAAATRATQPLAWLDRLVVFWRQLSPFAMLASLPLGLLLKRPSSARPRLLNTLFRWTPLVIGALRGLSGLSRPHPEKT